MRKKIKKKSEKINKISSTQEKQGERKMSITIMENPSNDKNNNINNNEKIEENPIERSESEENFLKAKEEAENLRKRLKEKNEEFEAYKVNNERELILINEKIKEKTEKLESVSYDSKILINKLNILNNKINEEYNKANIMQAANKIKINYLTEMKLKEKKKVNKEKKIIYLNNKIIDKFKIQKDKLEKLIKEGKNSKINDYKKKLNELNKEEENIKKEIENLRLKIQNHGNKCIQINENLNIILERLKNEYDEDYKSKTKENISKLGNGSISNSSRNFLPKIIKGNMLNNEKKNSRNYRSLTDLFGQDYFIQKDLRELKNKIRNNVKNKLSQKMKKYITSYSEQKKNNNQNNEKNNLFSKLEREMLKKIIPQECIERYQDKFKTIQNERVKIKKKIINNETKKKLNLEKSQLLFIAEKKENNIYKKNIELNSKIFILKKKIYNIQKETKIMKKELNTINLWGFPPTSLKI